MISFYCKKIYFIFYQKIHNYKISNQDKRVEQTQKESVNEMNEWNLTKTCENSPIFYKWKMNRCFFVLSRYI